MVLSIAFHPWAPFFPHFLVLLPSRALHVDILKSTKKEVFNKIRYEVRFHLAYRLPVQSIRVKFKRTTGFENSLIELYI